MKKYSRSFWLTCISMLFFMTSFNLILPELNDFITKLDGEDKKGLIISIFTISAALSRPFSGKLADYIGRKKVMYFGIFVSLLVSLLYPLSQSIFFFLILRFLHGFSAGFMPTGATALITDLLPAEKRGVGMGLWGTFISLGIGIGQTLSFLVVKLVGVDGMFIVSSALSLFAIIIMYKIQETLNQKQKFVPTQLLITWKDVFEPQVLPASMVMFLSAICSGIIFVLSADISKFLHLENKGWFFMFYVVSTMIVRLFTGRLSDIIGRRETLIFGMILLIASMIIVGLSRDVIMYSIGSVVFGLATGISSPTLFAWTADLSHIQRRGVGAGTMFIALEFGIMLGSFSTTFFYENTLNSVFPTFCAGAFCASLALIYLFWHLKFRTSLS
ncbi:MAG: MFS transporter [Bacteroidota bacterium]